MAKISKKPPSSMSSFEIANITGLAPEIPDNRGGISNEPITHIPNVDVFSTPGKLVIEVEMPGVRKDEIEVYLNRNTLTVKALKFECFDENKINYVCMERVFGRIYRAIEIPFAVDTAHIKAVYKNGILTLTIPRVQDKRCSTKRVDIESE